MNVANSLDPSDVEVLFSDLIAIYNRREISILIQFRETVQFSRIHLPGRILSKHMFSKNNHISSRVDLSVQIF